MEIKLKEGDVIEVRLHSTYCANIVFRGYLYDMFCSLTTKKGDLVIKDVPEDEFFAALYGESIENYYIFHREILAKVCGFERRIEGDQKALMTVGRNGKSVIVSGQEYALSDLLTAAKARLNSICKESDKKQCNKGLNDKQR